jgi:uncharacterized protein (TIGR00730 family)
MVDGCAARRGWWVQDGRAIRTRRYAGYALPGRTLPDRHPVTSRTLARLRPAYHDHDAPDRSVTTPTPHRLDAIAVFCGSLPGADPRHVDAARDLGALLARRGITLVYGGGRVGLMGAVADGALDAGGSVIGVIPQALVDRELAHTGVSELRVTGSMHERKALMASIADGFVAMPGGAGTLDELFEAWTWTMLGIHLKPCAVLDVGGFYAGLRTHVARMTSEGFIRPEHAEGLIFSGDADDLLEAMAQWQAPAPKWTTGPPTP